MAWIECWYGKSCESQASDKRSYQTDEKTDLQETQSPSKDRMQRVHQVEILQSQLASILRFCATCRKDPKSWVCTVWDAYPLSSGQNVFPELFNSITDLRHVHAPVCQRARSNWWARLVSSLVYLLPYASIRTWLRSNHSPVRHVPFVYPDS